MAVELIELVKAFVRPGSPEVRVVNGVNLSVGQGELVTLLGPSGCGKTTTLRMVAGFEEPTSGTIRIHGEDVTRVPPYRRHVPMVFQSYALFPHLTVRQNARFGLEMLGLGAKDADARIDAMARAMHLDGLLERGTHELSGGQQQRVALLRALVTEPKVLLFDEPLSNLDAQMRLSVRAEIRAMQQRLGFTSLYVTHDQAEAMAISDRVVVMEGGRVAQVGSPAELYCRPASRFVASFLGEANFVPATVTRAEGGKVMVDCAFGALELAGEAGAKTAQLVVRPEHLLLDASGTPARVLQCTFFGAEARCEVELSGLTLALQLPAPDPHALPKAGDAVRVKVRTERVHPLY